MTKKSVTNIKKLEKKTSEVHNYGTLLFLNFKNIM